MPHKSVFVYIIALQMWMSLIVMLRKADFGSSVTVFSSKVSFTKHINVPAIDKGDFIPPPTHTHTHRHQF